MSHTHQTDAVFHIHHDPPESVGKRERLGVRLLIIADGAFVFGMVFSYLYLRNLNVNGQWLAPNQQIVEPLATWQVTIPFLVAAACNALGITYRPAFRPLSLVGLAALGIGFYLQFRQVSDLPFINPETEKFESAYASAWFLLGGANLLHYLLTTFLALGLFLRSFRVRLHPDLELWRLRTAQSWFTWVAFSAVLCAVTTMLV